MPCRIYYDTPDGKMKLFCKVRVIFGEPMPAAQFAMEGRRDIKKLRVFLLVVLVAAVGVVAPNREGGIAQR